MTKRPLPMSPAYVQYVRGLRRLHALIAEGRDDSPEADAVRDSMDEPGYALSEAERRRVGGLSEDLYSLSDPPAEPLPSNPQVTRKLIEATKAREAGYWDLALELLRRWGNYVEPSYLSYLRGLLWQEAGDNATAALFLGHSSTLEPSNQMSLFSYLMALEKADPIAAERRAREILADENSFDPLVVTKAGTILFKSALAMEPGAGRSAFREIVGGLEGAYRRFEQADISESERDFSFIDNIKRNYIIQNIANCYRELGDNSAAVRYYNLGLAAAPDSPDLLVGRGTARYGSSPDASGDFLRAIHLGLREVWPYLFLAHDNFMTHRFGDCLEMCDRALSFPADDDIKARLHEWRAIARSELGFPEAMVRTDFEEAVRLAPEDDEIRQNFEAFNRSGGEPGARPHDWATSRASAIQALYRPEIGPLMPAA